MGFSLMSGLYCLREAHGGNVLTGGFWVRPGEMDSVGL